MDNASDMGGKYFGKYRGTVTKNTDPKGMGRLEVQVPSVLGDKKTWADPCVPFAGKDVGMFFMPEPGTMVWVEFEAGNPSKAIYTGFAWAEGDLSRAMAQPHLKFIKTKKFSLMVDEQKGEVEVKYGDNTRVKLTSLEVTIKAQTIKVEGANGRKLEIDGLSARVNQTGLEVL
ncbi:MAG: phage baseplate assembly protein V [Polyangiaceae bacterium]